MLFPRALPLFPKNGDVVRGLVSKMGALGAFFVSIHGEKHVVRVA